MVHNNQLFPDYHNNRLPVLSLKRWSLQVNQHVYNLLLDRSSDRDRALIQPLTDGQANAWLQPCRLKTSADG